MMVYLTSSEAFAMNGKKTSLAELSADLLGQGNVVRLRARGCSMHPFIRDGDLIEVEPTTTPSIGVGDVILFSVSSRQVFAHRVINKQVIGNEVVLLVKGDSKPLADHEVYPRQVLGKVVAVERNGWRVSLDRGLRRFVGMLYARISPWSPLLYPILRRVKRVMHYQTNSLE
jgi:hypothetical protein